MPLQPRRQSAEPEPADREHLRTMVEQSIALYTQWRPGYEQRNVDTITDALMLLLDGVDAAELPAETWNMRSEGLRAVILQLGNRLQFGEGEAAVRYNRNNFQAAP